MKEETKNSPGRSQKYTEETVMLSMRVPKSKKEAVKKNVTDFLKGDLKPNVIPEVEKDEIKHVTIPAQPEHITVEVGFNPAIENSTPESPTFPANRNEKKCDCYLDSQGFLRRGKSKPVCKLGKAEHSFE